jgi:hypothetical protein
MLRILSSIGGLLVPRAWAQGARPPIICGSLPGCGTNPTANAILSSAAGWFLDVVLTIVGAGSIAAIIWGGFLMVVANGDDAKLGKGKTAITYAIVGLFLAGGAGTVVSTLIAAVPGSGTFSPEGLLGYISTILLSLFDVAIVIVSILAGIRMVMARGNSEQFKRGLTTIVWAMVGAVIAHSASTIITIFYTIIQ